MGLYHVAWRKIDNEPRFIRYETDEQGQRLDPKFEPLPILSYFYAYRDAALRVFPPAIFESDNLEVGSRPVVKFNATSPDIVPLARDAIGASETFEADVPYSRRVLIDTGESVQMPKRYVRYDLEVDPSRGQPDEKVADMRIASIATKANDGEEKFFCNDDEEALIYEFIAYVTQFPILCAFNGNHFDEPYLRNRCKRLGIVYDWDVHVFIDILAVYKFVFLKHQDRYTLEHIAKEEKLSVQKRQIQRLPGGAPDIMYYFEHDRDTLREYNLDDVRILHELDQKMLIVSTVFNIAAISHTTPKDLLRVYEESTKEFNTSVAIDGLILHISGRRTPRVLWRTKEHRALTEEEEEARREKYAGAYVLPPVPGVHKNVALLDVGSMYPTIIQSFNMGPETYVPEGQKPSPGDIRSPIGRGWFHKEPKSVFSEALEYVLKFKNDYKKKLTVLHPDSSEWKATKAIYEAYKVMANAMYGVMGSDFSRYYNKDVAENITLTGQTTLKFLAAELERIGYKVVLGDTDSVAFMLPTLSHSMASKLATELTDKAIAYLEKLSGVRPTLLRLEIDKLCSALYIQPALKGPGGTKKRYAGFVVWETGSPTWKLMTKGFQVVRHDSSEAQKEFQTQGLMLVLSEAADERKTAFAEGWKRRLYAGELDEKIVMHKGLGKNPDEYKVIPPFLRVGRQLEKEGKLVLHKGDKIAYVKIGPRPEDVIAVLPGVVLSLTRDHYAFIWNNQFQRIAERLGINVTKEQLPKTPRKAKKVKKDPTLPDDHVCSTTCDETNHFRGWPTDKGGTQTTL